MRSATMKKIFEEYIDNVVVDTLIEDLHILREEIRALEALETLEPYQQQDLDYNKSMIKSIRNVLTYYIPYHDYEEKVGEPCPRPMYF